MELEASGWSGEGEFTKRLIDALAGLGAVARLRVEDAPASRADAGFSFISNEVFVRFATTATTVKRRRLWVLPGSSVVHAKAMTLGQLQARLAALADVGDADYSDDGMLQYLRTERVLQPYQTSKGYKLIELVRIYEWGTAPRREG